MNAPALKTGRSWWKGAAIGGVLLVAFIAVGASVYARFFFPQALKLQESDRELLVTIRDFEPWLKRFTPRTDAEVTKKLRRPDGVLELSYEYLHPDSEREVYVRSLVEIHPTRTTARESYALLAARELPMTPFSGVKYEHPGDPLAWVEAARLGVLTNNGKPRGHFFHCRQNERVLCIEVFGVYLENEEHFQDLAFGRFNVLSEYTP